MYNKLLNKDYIASIIGSGVLLFSSLLYDAAISLWIYENTGSTVLMGLVSSISLFINVLLQPIAGSVIDHLKKKGILIFFDAITAIVFICIGLLTTQVSLNNSLIFILGITATIDGAFCGSAAATIIADILDKKILVKGSSISSSIMYLIRIATNAIKGGLILALPIHIVIIIYGACYGIACLSHFLLTDYPAANKQKLDIKNFFADLKTAGNYCLEHRGLLKLLCIIVCANLFTTGFDYILVAYISQSGMSIEQYGYLPAIQAFGSFLGFVIVSQLKINDDNRLIYCMGSFFVGEIFMALGLFIAKFYLTASLTFLGFIFNGIGNGILTATLLSVLPATYRGVIYGFVNVASTLGTSLSTLIYGYLGDVIIIKYLGLFGHSIACLVFGLCYAFNDVKCLFSQVD